MEKIIVLILDRSLIVERDLVDILIDAKRRHEMVELMRHQKIALYMNNGQKITERDFSAALDKGASRTATAQVG